MAVSDAECSEDTLVTAPRHPADNTISNICSAEIQMRCHFQVGVLLNPVMILKHFTCNLQAASSTQSPLPTFYLQKNILLVWSRLLPTAGPECAGCWAGVICLITRCHSCTVTIHSTFHIALHSDQPPPSSSAHPADGLINNGGHYYDCYYHCCCWY